MAKLYIGAIGTKLTVRLRDEDTGLPLDISSASVHELICTSPSGAEKLFHCDFVTNGQDGRVTYTTQAGDLDKAGEWLMQAHIVLPTLDTRSQAKSFTVFGR
jgi:hypothetical protein